MSYNFGSHKIINFSNVKTFFSKIKKKKTVIHCHGVFDLVHPGHIRHFAHCRSKADVLVVSLTPDIYIKKGKYRPLIPEKMRAGNLAALEMVDFVIIDKNKFPYQLLNLIKPNYFAKGMEYFLQKNILTEKEKKIVEKNGGKMIFSPGDYVMSSTKLINESKIDLKYEKLKVLMDVENINFKDLKKILNSLNKINVHIIGDTIIDTNHYCEAIGGLHKTPTLSIVKKRSQDYLGGAAIVAAHFKSFTKNVSLTTAFGNDKKGKFAKKEINKLKIKLNQISEFGRDTTNKNSYIVDKHKLLKVDEVNNSSILNSTIEKISKIIKKEKNKIIVCSDFRHGIFNKQTVSIFLKSINKSCFKVADSQVASRWGNITDFQNFDLITPTEREARYSLFEQDLPIRAISNVLLKKSNPKNLILKLGSRGLISLNRKRNDYIVLDPFVNNLIDSNGAGDALLAYSAASLYVTNSLIISSIIGLLAASCKCEKEGNIAVKKQDIEKKIDEIEQIIN
jgi:rfaE bifunctional protein nucleotidyltransferase chain/domain|tara:strand:+ start:1206 stop:2726 length:1521 start_codon:yes stop_codon:yes gene_type:complete